MTTELIKELSWLCVEKNWNFEGYIDYTFFGISNLICVCIFLDNTDVLERFNIKLGEDDDYTQLQAVIDRVKAL